jgi:carboxypeptidase Taq
VTATPPELTALHERAAILADLGHIHSLLFWDQNTMMPPDGAPARGDQSATLEAVAHERLTDPELGRLLDALEPWAAQQDPDADDVRLVHELRRDFEKRERRRTSPASATRSSAKSSCVTATSTASPASSIATTCCSTTSSRA